MEHIYDQDNFMHHHGAITKKSWIPARYGFVILAFLGFFNAYSLRVSLSVAIVAMVNNSLHNGGNEAFDVSSCPAENYTNSSAHDLTNNGRFDWDSRTQGLILGSFFYGYICTQILGGWVSQKYSGKHAFGYAVLLSGLLSLLIPVAAKWRYEALIAVRVFQGLFQGVCFPSMHSMLGRWAPPLELSRMASIAYSGVQVGTVCSLIMSGILAEKLGWESIFYVSGVAAILWYIFWLFFGFDDPSNHPRITEDERQFIIRSIGTAKVDEDNRLPWRKLLLSLPVYALCVANFGHNWGFYTLLTNIPTYLSKVLHFDLEANGLLSALPYVIMTIVMQLAGFVADWLRKRNILSTTVVRKSFHVAGQILPAICLMILGNTGCDIFAAISLLTLAVGLDGIATSGYQVNHVDISPTHSGLLMGISNTFGTIPGILGPFVVGQLTDGPLGESIIQWRTVFYITAGIYIGTAVFFAIFASGKLASWEKRRLTDTSEEEDAKLISHTSSYRAI